MLQRVVATAQFVSNTRLDYSAYCAAVPPTQIGLDQANAPLVCLTRT